jgi:hypothetical protein
MGTLSDIGGEVGAERKKFNPKDGRIRRAHKTVDDPLVLHSQFQGRTIRTNRKKLSFVGVSIPTNAVGGRRSVLFLSP